MRRLQDDRRQWNPKELVFDRNITLSPLNRSLILVCMQYTWNFLLNKDFDLEGPKWIPYHVGINDNKKFPLFLHGWCMFWRFLLYLVVLKVYFTDQQHQNHLGNLASFLKMQIFCPHFIPPKSLTLEEKVGGNLSFSSSQGDSNAP